MQAPPASDQAALASLGEFAKIGVDVAIEI